MIHELQKMIWLDTPKGLAVCHFMIDYGPESDLYWVCFIQENGEIWMYENSQVRAVKNITLGRTLDKKEDPKIYRCEKCDIPLPGRLFPTPPGGYD